MKTPAGYKNVDTLEEKLAKAAATPLVPPPVARIEVAVKPSKRKAAADTVPVFLRLDRSVFARYNELAVARTRETGKGVSVQQIIAERLEQSQ
jgi:hypothetical protein